MDLNLALFTLIEGGNADRTFRACLGCRRSVPALTENFLQHTRGRILNFAHFIHALIEEL